MKLDYSQNNEQMITLLFFVQHCNTSSILMKYRLCFGTRVPIDNRIQYLYGIVNSFLYFSEYFSTDYYNALPRHQQIKNGSRNRICYRLATMMIRLSFNRAEQSM